MLGLRTTIYKVVDLNSAKNWYVKAFEATPYFEEKYYVGFNIGGYELGLMPQVHSKPKGDNIITYWGVDDVQKSFQHLLACGSRVHEVPNNVGGDIEVASVFDPWDNIIGIIYNPHFKEK
jgi:lactoylglutathione lyase